MRRSALAALLFAAAACGDGGGGPGGRRCLSDQEVCQFEEGVTTTTQVRAALGNPQITQSVGGTGGGLQQWVYICQQTQQTVDAVQFVFDENGVLFGVTVLRSGPNVPPAPVCS